MGGLVVRVVFQPLEEAAFTAFSTWHTGKADSAHDQHAAADDRCDVWQ